MRSLTLATLFAFTSTVYASAAGSPPVMYDLHAGNKTRTNTEYTHVNNGDPIFGWEPLLVRHFWFENVSEDDKAKITLMQDGKAVSVPSPCKVDIDFQNAYRDDKHVTLPVSMVVKCEAGQFLKKNEGGIKETGVYTVSFDYYSANEDEDYKGFATMTLPVTSVNHFKKTKYFPDYDAFAHQAFISEYTEDGVVQARFNFWGKFKARSTPDLALSCRIDGKEAFRFSFNSGDGYSLPDDSAMWVHYQPKSRVWIRFAEWADEDFIKQSYPNAVFLADSPGQYDCKARNDDGDVVTKFFFEIADGKVVPSGCEGDLILPMNAAVIKRMERSAQLDVDPAAAKVLGPIPDGC